MTAQRMTKKLLRPRWIAVGLLVAVTAVTAALVATTTATSADAIPFSNPAHPVVDANWIYDHNFFESNEFIYKVAGSDGCLPGATTCPGGGTPGDTNNLPPNYNGAQEFYTWWKGVGTTHTPQPNGKLGLWVTARDHLFPTRSWQLNDAELTIPGAVCAGQQVMLASHNDSTPVSTNPASGAVSGSATPMSTMHSGNWGNGSGYDANMGENMNLEEIGSVLRWHEVNGTYPARTIKATLYDNEEGGLVGSGDYSAAGTPAAIIAAPTAVGDTNIKVTSTNNLGAGTTIALDEVNTENPTVASVGTAAANTTLVFPASAGDSNIKVASISGFSAGDGVSLDLGSLNETNTVQTVGTAARTSTTLAAPANAGDTNIKVAATTSGGNQLFVVGEPLAITEVTGGGAELRTIAAIGTAGASGTGVTLTAPLGQAHGLGATVQDTGTGLTLSSALTNAHLATSRVVDTSNLGTGITLTAPLTKAHAYGSTVNGSATGLLSDSPQGRIIGVLNNDQDGLNYPTHKWGTGYYMSNLLDGQAGPWFNNINATPVSSAPNSVYGAVGIQRLQHNLPAVQAFRSSAADAVTQSLQDLGQKYNFSIPLENPLQFKNTGSVPDSPGIQSVPAYLPSDQALYTPVLDDRTGRTDQVSFGVRGIPSLGDIGQYDSSTDPLVGGNDNPYPPGYPSKPTLAGEFGQDSNSDYFSNLNYWASGTVHGPGGYDKPSEGLLRGVEFIATWFSYVIASPQEGGAVTQPKRPIAYFEMSPKKPTAQSTVTFDAGYSRTKSGSTDGLTYYWDFGDGSPMVMTTDPLIQHTFPTQAAWRDVKLLVAGAGQANDPSKYGSFRQVEPIDFFPTYYPALVPPTEPAPPTTGGTADPCGALTADEQAALIDEARDAKHASGDTPTQADVASAALTSDASPKVGSDSSDEAGSP
jgi:PKD domain